MLSKDPQLAPAPVIVRYLAVFQRALVAIEGYTLDGDKPGILFGGWLADALPNVPGMLWHCDPDAFHNLDSMDAWMSKFPDLVAKRAAPSRLADDCRRIVSVDGTAHELGLREDLADYKNSAIAKCAVLFSG